MRSTRLQDDGFKVRIAARVERRPAGVVFGQNPRAARTRQGHDGQLSVSSGRSARSTVPNAVGRSQADARDAAREAGFTVTTAQVFSDQPAGTVAAQDPAAGTRAAPARRVRINVSKGAADVAGAEPGREHVRAPRPSSRPRASGRATTPVPSSSDGGGHGRRPRARPAARLRRARPSQLERLAGPDGDHDDDHGHRHDADHDRHDAHHDHDDRHHGTRSTTPKGRETRTARAGRCSATPAMTRQIPATSATRESAPARARRSAPRSRAAATRAARTSRARGARARAGRRRRG